MVIKTKVLFKLLKLVKKIGVLDEIKSLFRVVSNTKKEDLEKLQEEAGIDLVIKIISNLDTTETEVYDLLADIQEKTADEIKEQDLDITINTLKELFMGPVFRSFLSSISK